jgi:hypothetical protein
MASDKTKYTRLAGSRDNIEEKMTEVDTWIPQQHKEHQPGMIESVIFKEVKKVNA